MCSPAPQCPARPKNGSDPAETRSSLVRRLKCWDDNRGWQEFFDTYWRLIYAVATRAGLTDAEAQDVVQETVVSVAKQLRESGYDRDRGSFKNWLCLITRRRIVDYLRRRTDPHLRHVPVWSADPAATDTLERVPDTTGRSIDDMWEEEWRRNLFEAALETVKQQVNPRQYQIFNLSVLRELPMSDVTALLKVNAAQVYVARHRVGALVKKEVRRLEARAERSGPPDRTTG